MFHENLREFRKDKGLTQKDLANFLGVSISTYANWEQGRRKPDVDNIKLLCEFFNVDFLDFFIV